MTAVRPSYVAQQVGFALSRPHPHVGLAKSKIESTPSAA